MKPVTELAYFSQQKVIPGRYTSSDDPGIFIVVERYKGNKLLCIISDYGRHISNVIWEYGISDLRRIYNYVINADVEYTTDIENTVAIKYLTPYGVSRYGEG